MKKKLGDFTIREVYETCRTTPCKDCPFCYVQSFTREYSCWYNISDNNFPLLEEPEDVDREIECE